MRRLDLLRTGRAALRFSLLALLVPLATGLSNPATAGADEVEEERLEAIERHTERAWKAFRSGNHEEVLARMQRVARYDPENPLPTWLGARVEMRVGHYAKALEVAEEGASTHPAHKGLDSTLFDGLLTLGRLTDPAGRWTARLTDELTGHGAAAAFSVAWPASERQE